MGSDAIRRTLCLALPLWLFLGVGGLKAQSQTASPADTTDRVAYVDVPLREVLADVRQRTGVQFLYRDALVAGVTVSFRAETARLLNALREAAARNGLSIEVDTRRKQALLTRAERATASPVVTGQVVDRETGTRLPLATLTWPLEGRRRGVAADETGAFRLVLDGDLARRDSLVLTVSYVGYAPTTVRIDPAAPPAELSVRLSPRRMTAPEVVVQSLSLQSDLDTTWRALLRPERYVPLGESSVLRSLQTLPSVSITPALSGGLTVRGSRDDGFHVLLDGMSIYNQNHLFGLFDAFNAEALQTVGFYYGVAPADYPAPPGGTIAFHTRTGSQTGVHAAAEVSPTAVSGTVEGPLADGQGSWLVSARHSILNVGWWGNDDLIAEGLGVDRSTAPLPGAAQDLEAQLLLPGAPSARFFDVHGTAAWETDGGQRWRLSTYAGGDVAEQGGRRIVRDDTPTLRERFRDRDFLDTTAVETTNRWGNLGASLQWQHALGDRTFSHWTAAVSRYHSRYQTDDFLYVRPRPGNVNVFTAPLSHQNELIEGSLTHRLITQMSSSASWTGGYALRFYDIDYTEESAVFPTFDGGQQSVQADAFGQMDATLPGAELHLGLRVHHFSQGSYTRISPRIQARLGPERPVSVGLGYSRNHQFLHRLELVNDVSSAVWIPSTEAQPPGLVDHLTAGVYAHPSATTALQVEAYWKEHQNLRLHETVSRLQRTDTSVLFDPWTTQNDAQARGVEALVRQAIGPVSWTTAYAFSRVAVAPADELGSEPAGWDRRHQLTTRLAGSWGPVSAHATWMYATGVPNPYADVLPRREPDRLGAYHRLDLGISLQQATGPVDWTGRVGLFNAYDRSNPWYREPKLVLRPDGPDLNRRRELGVAVVDVYDLGLRPSLSVSARW